MLSAVCTDIHCVLFNILYKLIIHVVYSNQEPGMMLLTDVGQEMALHFFVHRLKEHGLHQVVDCLLLRVRFL